MRDTVENIRISEQEVISSPMQIKTELVLSRKARANVARWRTQVQNILSGDDRRLFIVVGPCSIHDVSEAQEYASRLKQLSDQVSDTLLLIMRVYFEKPRTTTGWKGLINDPELNDSFKIEKGLRIARKLLIDINELGLPAATEALDPIVPQYLHDLITWSAIGARTTESQTHREMASGLSSPVGFKNGTDGGLGVMINALQSAARPHRFLGIDDVGKVAIMHTTGNPWAHAVLRGGSQGPNYDSAHIADCEAALKSVGVPENIVVDCSHANSNKQYELQPLVMSHVGDQIRAGNCSICGLMLESNLASGKQKIPQDLDQLRYGVSVTDACIDWETTENSIKALREQLREVLPKRADRPGTDGSTTREKLTVPA